MTDTSSSIAARAAESGGLLANGGASALAETTLWLMLVVGLILALAWFAKRFGGVQFRHHGSMKLLSALPLGNREKIVLMQAGDKYLLLGVTPSQINTLHVFDEQPKEIATVNKDAVADSGSGFQQLLRFAMTNRSSSSLSAQTVTDSSSGKTL